MVVGESGPLATYWRFHEAVAEAQLAAWLPLGKRLIVDISGPRAHCAAQAAAAGHHVLRVVNDITTEKAAPGDAPPPGRPRVSALEDSALEDRAPGYVTAVAAEPGNLSFLADGCADGVTADDRTLSRYLVAEDLVAEMARVLRPAGRVLACVDSLVLGMAILAEQHHWAQLIDLPCAEVVLVPWPDGMITRCFGAEQLRELFSDAGMEVISIRPRTVLSPSTVAHVLNRNPAGLTGLVQAELSAGPDESVGIQLVISAIKRAGTR
jgi:hypothetical protein